MMGPSTANIALTITETDEVDTPIATYVYSELKTTETRDAEQPETKQPGRKGRLDIVVSIALRSFNHSMHFLYFPLPYCTFISYWRDFSFL
jgi:hypothetical protein